jgi:hypothetical protein
VTTNRCTPQGQQCAPVFPPCCPELICQPLGDRAYCEPFSKHSSATNFPSPDPFNEHGLVY